MKKYGDVLIILFFFSNVSLLNNDPETCTYPGIPLVGWHAQRFGWTRYFFFFFYFSSVFLPCGGTPGTGITMMLLCTSSAGEDGDTIHVPYNGGVSARPMARVSQWSGFQGSPVQGDVAFQNIFERHCSCPRVRVNPNRAGSPKPTRRQGFSSTQLTISGRNVRALAYRP